MIESWSSPRNDRFVRQQIPEFLNPSLEVRVSARNYPATHFVGVAGVGEDAADLPAGDPRAGVFGNSRPTRLEDIHDGASNTLMVLGVTSELGSWAAGGTATVRPLTREPYVNGPDGFGTGLTDRMMVLKADGSVAEMSATTDPRIFRRMAAIADGLPLDPKIPGEPGDHSRHPVEQPGPMASVRAGGPGDGGRSRQQPAPTAGATAAPSATTRAAAPRTDRRRASAAGGIGLVEQRRKGPRRRCLGRPGPAHRAVRASQAGSAARRAEFPGRAAGRTDPR